VEKVIVQFSLKALATHPKHERDDEDDALYTSHASVEVVVVSHCHLIFDYPARD